MATVTNPSLIDLAELAKVYGPAAAEFYRSYETQSGMAPAETYSFNVESNKGNSTGNVYVSNTTPIALVDNRTGEVVSSGVGIDAAKQIENFASGLTEAGGNKANWSIYTAPTGATSVDQFTLAANEKANQSALGKISDIALPTLGAFLAPMTGGSSLLMTGLGAAGGSALSSALQGRSLEDTLMRAALSGGMAAGTSALLQPASGFSTALAEKTGNQMLNSQLAGAFANLPANAATSGLAGVYSGLADELLVQGLQSGAGSLLGGAVPSLLANMVPINPAAGVTAPDFSLEPGVQELVSTAQVPTGSVPVPGFPGFYRSPTGELIDTNDIVSTGEKPSTPTTPPINIGTTDLTGNMPNTNPTTGITPPNFAGGGGGLTTTDYLTLATLAAGALGGGGGGGTSSILPYTGTQLRAPRSFTPADYTVTPYAGDYEKYGFGPAHNFYSRGYYGIVPNAAAPAPATPATTTGNTSLI